MGAKLTEQDFADAAEALQCDVAAVKAVAEVESRGGGFLSDGNTPVILFEAHIFHRLTKGRHTIKHPNISSAVWNRALYATGPTFDARGMAEHKRLQEAVALDRDAALQSASWGMFQIMGFNYAQCGAPTVQEFINDMYASEGRQLMAFVRFLQSSNLVNALRGHDWVTLAKGYNGPGYAANQYDKKLAAAWAKFNTEAERMV